MRSMCLRLVQVERMRDMVRERIAQRNEAARAAAMMVDEEDAPVDADVGAAFGDGTVAAAASPSKAAGKNAARPRGPEQLWHLSARYRALVRHKLKGDTVRVVQGFEAKSENRKGKKSKDDLAQLNKIIAEKKDAEVELELDSVLQPPFWPGEEAEAAAKLAAKAATVQQIYDLSISRRAAADPGIEARLAKEKREYDVAKEIVEAQKFFGSSSGGMTPREQIKAWMRLKKQSASRATLEDKKYEDMLAKLDDRVKAINDTALYELDQRDREVARTYRRRTQGIARLNDLAMKNTSLAACKDVTEIQHELVAVRKWADMIRVEVRGASVRRV